LRVIFNGEKEVSQLHRLARLYGIEISHYDGMGRLQRASEESLLTVLKALGAPLNDLRDVESALRQYKQEQWQRCCEPVTLAWDGELSYLELNLPADRAEGRVDCELELEYGEVRNWTSDLNTLPTVQATAVEGNGFVVKRLQLPQALPWGYHRLKLFLAAESWETLIISASRRAYGVNRIWGGFLPLYALESQRSWGAGNLSDLKVLLNRLREMGGSIVGTLPLLASFMEEPFEPSPYSPVSKLFWNEFYIDITRVPEMALCPPAQHLLESTELQLEIRELRTDPLVDYRRGMAVKRKILEELARCCFSSDSERQRALWRWASEDVRIRDYARFRAVVEKRRSGWPVWPQRLRDGHVRQEDYDPEVERYHLYVQWVVQEQLQSLSSPDGKQPSGLYLDLPLGVNGGGYDVWRERRAFALEASTGAPPDTFFTRGQDWGFSPLHPERIRQRGYRYYIACLRNHMKYAGILRLDHVAGLHRLFWIPKGHGAENGVYVRYRAEEFYALLALESQRNKTALVGEDLGTVPDQVRADMDNHNVYRMYILPFQKRDDRGLNPVPADCLASLNTHDMPPFSAYWSGLDANERRSLIYFLAKEGFLDANGIAGAEDILMASLKYLAASSARILLVNLEDLWLEMAPQNVPGTLAEHPNWRRKARCSLEAVSEMPRSVFILNEINRLRQNYNAKSLES
jgi:4-alpha-glucanotransferase